jgi:hypothetical protein
MSRRTLTPRSGRVGRAAGRMAPGGRVVPEAPITRVKERTGGMGLTPTEPPPTCECWDVPASVLPATYVDIRAVNEEFFQDCLPEYYNYYGNDTVPGLGSGSSWSATMGQGTHVTVTIAESPSAVYIQMFVGDTADKLQLVVYATDFITQYTITSATICPDGVAPPAPVDPWAGVGYLEFSGLWRVGGTLYCDTITDWGTTLTHPATGTYVEVITSEGYSVRWYASPPSGINRWLVKIHSAKDWYLWNFNVPQLYNGQTGTALPTSVDKAVPSGYGFGTIFYCGTLEGGGAGSASVAGSIRLRRLSVP